MDWLEWFGARSTRDGGWPPLTKELSGVHQRSVNHFCLLRYLIRAAAEYNRLTQRTITPHLWER